MKYLLRDTRLWICGVFILLVVVIALLAPWVAPQSPNEMNSQERLKAPSSAYVLGTDEFGRDILSRLIYGARLSLFVSLTSVTMALILGGTMGLIAGYSGGRLEQLIMRGVDIILSFPAILSAIFVVAFIGTELRNVIFTIGLLYSPRFARIVHGVTLATKENEYVEAARAIGSPTWRILFFTILPNIMAPIIVQVSLSMGNAILLESSLSFLGMGPPPPTTAWGRMISESGPFMHLSPYIVIWPAVIISTTILAFNILGDAIRDALDPRLHQA